MTTPLLMPGILSGARLGGGGAPSAVIQTYQIPGFGFWVDEQDTTTSQAPGFGIVANRDA